MEDLLLNYFESLRQELLIVLLLLWPNVVCRGYPPRKGWRLCWGSTSPSIAYIVRNLPNRVLTSQVPDLEL